MSTKNDKSFMCPLCDKDYSNKHRLNTHSCQVKTLLKKGKNEGMNAMKEMWLLYQKEYNLSDDELAKMIGSNVSIVTNSNNNNSNNLTINNNLHVAVNNIDDLIHVLSYVPKGYYVDFYNKTHEPGKQIQSCITSMQSNHEHTDESTDGTKKVIQKPRKDLIKLAENQYMNKIKIYSIILIDKLVELFEFLLFSDNSKNHMIYTQSDNINDSHSFVHENGKWKKRESKEFFEDFSDKWFIFFLHGYKDAKFGLSCTMVQHVYDVNYEKIISKTSKRLFTTAHENREKVANTYNSTKHIETPVNYDNIPDKKDDGVRVNVNGPIFELKDDVPTTPKKPTAPKSNNNNNNNNNNNGNNQTDISELSEEDKIFRNELYIRIEQEKKDVEKLKTNKEVSESNTNTSEKEVSESNPNTSKVGSEQNPATKTRRTHNNEIVPETDAVDIELEKIEGVEYIVYGDRIFEHPGDLEDMGIDDLTEMGRKLPDGKYKWYKPRDKKSNNESSAEHDI